MEYFKINNIDFSMYVSALKVSTTKNYTAQTNAAGDTVVDYINKKRIIEVGIIALNADVMANLQNAINNLSVSISFRNPNTNTMENGVVCMLPNDDIEYYTIQDKKVMYKEFVLTFIEL
jgi:hypothetical protein